MPNPHAGEVQVVVDGTPRVAKLTLGALAELEAALKVCSQIRDLGILASLTPPSHICGGLLLRLAYPS